MTQQPWLAEKRIELHKARMLIEKHTPELIPVSVMPLGEGWDNVAYLVNDQYVFRFPRRSVAVPLMLKEVAFLPVVAPRLSLPVPVPLYFCESSPDFSWPFSGYKLLPGKTLCSNNLAAEDRINLAEPLAVFLKQLHQLPVSIAERLGMQRDQLKKLDTAERLPRTVQWLDGACQKGAIDKSVRDKLATMLAALVGRGGVSRSECIVHGDLYARHLLVDEGRLSGVIDWGDAAIGGAAIDLAVMFMLFEGRARDLFVNAYGEIDEVTRRLSLFRAISFSAAIMNYAVEVEDKRLVTECLRSLKLIAETSG